MSAYVEIASSKCTNNISWKFTQMPILILDEKFMSLEKVEDTSDLCMDVVLRVFDFVSFVPLLTIMQSA